MYAACAVSALLSKVAGCGGGETEFDVALGQEELTEKSLQLTHLLPAGYIPVSHTISSRSIGTHHANAPNLITPLCNDLKHMGTLYKKCS